MKNVLIKILAGTTFLSSASLAQAAWPDDKPIEIIVGFAAGGETDIMARGLAPFIGKHLGGKATMIVVNKVGASGEIGNAYLQRSQPDGYTLGVVNVPPLLFVPLIKKAQYDPKEFALLARAVSDPTLLIVQKNSPFTSLKQVVLALKEKPRSLSFGYNGIGTNGHLAMLQLQSVTGISLNDIPFNGSGPSKNALLGGHTQFMFTSLTAVPNPEQEATPLRILSQFMEKRVSALPNVPTAREEGLDVIMPSDRGFAVPKAVPSEIRLRLEKAIEASLKDPEFLKTATSYASVISFQSGAEWQRSLDDARPAMQTLVNMMATAK